MGLDGFDRLYQSADTKAPKASVAVAGADDPTVLEAMRAACDSGWVRPILVGPEPQIRSVAESHEIDLDQFEFRHADRDSIAATAVALVHSGRAVALVKGQISTPDLMSAVLDRQNGLRTGRVVCQVVLMEI